MSSVLRTAVLGGILGAGIVGGGALAAAQTSGTTVPPAAEAPGTVPGTTEPPVTEPGTTAPPATGETPAAPEGRGARPGKGERHGKDERHGKGGKPGRGHHGHFGHLAGGGEALATELGVTVEQLRDARKAAAAAVRDLGKPTRPATRPPSDEDKAKFAEELKARAELFNKTMADKLGVSTDRLRDARVAVLSKRLDEAVASGKLTREKADEILAKLRDGVDAGDFAGRPHR